MPSLSLPHNLWEMCIRDRADLAAAIADYARRERRYGMTSEQVKPAVAAAE